MNSGHGLALTTGSSAVTMIGIVLAAYLGVDANVAGALAWLIVMGIGTVVALVVWFVKWKYPDAPALPEFGAPLGRRAPHDEARATVAALVCVLALGLVVACSPMAPLEITACATTLEASGEKDSVKLGLIATATPACVAASADIVNAAIAAIEKPKPAL